MKRWVGIAPFRLTTLAVALLATVIPVRALASTAAPVAPTRPATGPVVPVLNWQPCDAGFECATAQVPLDYHQPRGRMIDIAVIRHLATDPAHRIGSLFFNPGGPGGSGVLALPLIYTLFPAQVRAQFDLVSFDPRGVGASTAVQCYPNFAAEAQALAGLPTGFPVGTAQIQTWDRIVAAFDHTCGVAAGDLLAHLSTANVARDMDLLRQAVGDPQMNYLGVSYGTYLGATYANLFPGKVRAMVLDGNINPVAWATGYGNEAGRLGTALRIGQDEGMAATLRAFLTLCGQAAPGACVFSAGSAAATQAKYQALLQRLGQRPVVLGGVTVTYALAVEIVAAYLYTVEPEPAEPGSWAALATLLQEVWTASVSTGTVPMPARPSLPSILDPAVLDPAVIGAAPVTTDSAAPAAAQAYSGTEQQIATLCDDSPNPRDPASYPAQAAFAYARSGAFGPYRAWATEPCAQWPAFDSDRYAGPWNVRTANPLLVVGNTTDPATPYQGSLAMSRDLARARLLTVDGWGHTEFLNPSSCTQAYESAYLINGTLPPVGATCQPDQQPFSAP
jgi:pimeloyl-ACP methyl ester carboxylesterase